MRKILKLSPIDPTRFNLKRAASTGDPFAVRRAAEAYLRRRRDLGRPVTGRETARLDVYLYGRSPVIHAFDAKAEIQAIMSDTAS